MLPWKTKLVQSVLNVLYYSGAYKKFALKWEGVGIIFTLHRVRPYNSDQLFNPNGILEITPKFLEQTIQQVLDAGIEVVDLDEAVRRLSNKCETRRFCLFYV